MVITDCSGKPKILASTRGAQAPCKYCGGFSKEASGRCLGCGSSKTALPQQIMDPSATTTFVDSYLSYAKGMVVAK